MLTLNVQNADAIKNYLLPDKTVCKIYDIHMKHRDAYSKRFIEHISKFDVMGYTMHYKFEPRDYVFIHVDYPPLRKTVFVAEPKALEHFMLKDLLHMEVLVRYNHINGIPCW